MESSYKEIIRKIIETYNQSGVIWKITGTKHYGKSHLEKRQSRKDLPSSWKLKDYNALIINIINDMTNDVYIYYLPAFTQNYFVFSNGTWIIIVGQDKVIETAMKGNPDNYFRNNPGYTYVGKAKDVFK